MKLKSILAALLLMVAGLQTAWGQGFRVYKSDGTVAQFSLRTDSIVFYDGIGTDVDFGPFTPVTQCIAGTWYQSKSETVTFREDGTTDYMADATYKFFPYQGNIVFFNASYAPINILKVYEVTAGKMIVSSPDGSNLSVWSSTKPVQLVTSITLNQASLSLVVGKTQTLTATVLPSNATNKAVAWTSSNTSVATVSTSGMVTAKAVGTCTITCAATDGSGVKAECQVTVKKPDTMEYVDLGLPSGTKWATCNVGASKPEEYGDYFAWGETTTKSIYDWSTYKWCNGDEYTMTKYCTRSKYGYNGFTDNLTELQPEDDAATANWGSGWKMPSYDQIKELCNGSYTTSEWTQLNGVYGRKVTSKSNGNSIFLPAAGDRSVDELSETGLGVYYWSSSLSPDNDNHVYYLGFYSSYSDWWGLYVPRYYGRSVRAVRVP